MQLTSTAGQVDFVRTKTELDILSIPEIGYVEASANPSPFVWRGIAYDSFGNGFVIIRYGRWAWGVFHEWRGASAENKAFYGCFLKRTLRKALKHA